ncbi:hypothetical protein STIAU_6987, partial [Stigmatella aurantiaca DW4/3-1]
MHTLLDDLHLQLPTLSARPRSAVLGVSHRLHHRERILRLGHVVHPDEVRPSQAAMPA